MADGGDFDPCECINILNHEGRMQRLISMLRNSQTSCTDSDCLTDGGLSVNPTGSVNGSESQLTFMTLMMGWILIAVVLYFMRPNRRQSKNPMKPSPDANQGNGDQDPAPIF